MCEYTDHGHCGALCGHSVDNDATLELLADRALPRPGGDAGIVAPSDMMDAAVWAIQEPDWTSTDSRNVPIPVPLGQVHASAFYGPLPGGGAGSAPPSGTGRDTRWTHLRNRAEAPRSALDVEEGGRPLWIGPALPIWMIREVCRPFRLPLCAYQVSGEYAMIKAAAREGLD